MLGRESFLCSPWPLRLSLYYEGKGSAAGDSERCTSVISEWLVLRFILRVENVPSVYMWRWSRHVMFRCHIVMGVIFQLEWVDVTECYLHVFLAIVLKRCWMESCERCVLPGRPTTHSKAMKFANWRKSVPVFCTRTKSATSTVNNGDIDALNGLDSPNLKWTVTLVLNLNGQSLPFVNPQTGKIMKYKFLPFVHHYLLPP